MQTVWTENENKVPMMLLHATLVMDFYMKTGHWPDIIFVDPTSIHRVGMELEILWSRYPNLPSIVIRFDNRIPAQCALACDFINMLETVEECETLFEHKTYIPQLSQSSLN